MNQLLKIITTSQVYEVRLDEIRVAELLKQIELRRLEQMITLGKSEGMPYLIGIKPAHLVGYEVHPEPVVAPDTLSKAAGISSTLTGLGSVQVDSPEVAALKAELENLKALQVNVPEVKKSGRPKKV